MIQLPSESFDAGAALSSFMAKADGAGAVASFIGLVRPEEARVTALFLDHHPIMTQSVIEGAVREAEARWALRSSLIIHRVGEVVAGEPIVLVATAADHRREAFEACDFLMDFLKTDAPFWKKEQTVDGDAWISPRAADYKDRARWT